MTRPYECGPMRQVLLIDVACSRLMIATGNRDHRDMAEVVGVRCENRRQHLRPPTMDGLTWT